MRRKEVKQGWINDGREREKRRKKERKNKKITKLEKRERRNNQGIYEQVKGRKKGETTRNITIIASRYVGGKVKKKHYTETMRK